ncbi:transforming growth factor beta receptor type 3-like [Protopterus annectens]|uniref:transforming growth factor beta receptor type 3-like n=1 Tax=Protopterus annectens TaxID=7888 RepID=UPI001CF9B35F|nr:transforming growth factor beta receptor type 3-like [Protopterus annectens]XP_043940469.1 transforming growth factor beta receptor type 3-like [Protopterus annectens]
MFGAVTTLVQYSLVNNVYLTLGEDSLAPSTCTLQENFLSEKYLASELKPYSLQGCINHNQQLIPDVHVICLQEGTFNPYSVLQTQIIIEIQSQQTNHTIQCHLILILQNKKPISCVVRSHNAHGQLTVHASDSITITVNTEPSLIVKKMSLPNLSTSKDLHSWTQQHRLPSVTSYTEAKLANRLRIIIRDNGGTEPKAPSYSCSTDKDIQPANDPKEAWSQLTLESGKEATLKQNGINQTLEIVKERLTFMKKVVRMMGRNHTAITVTCLPQKMVVEISKDTLQMLGTLPSKITLRDQSCTATSNSTHFLLETPLNSCGTVTATDPLGEGFDILYQNSVLLWQQSPIAQAKQDDFNETLSTQQKAEDGPRILNFSCVYPTFEPPTASLEDKPNEEEVEAVNFPVFLSNALFRLDLYNSELFTQRQHGAYKVVVNSHVFVEVTMTLRSAKLSFTILKCYHSPASDPEQHTGHALIEKACPLDESVTFYATHHRGLPINPTSQEHQRFSFLLRPLYNDSIQFLHCKLTMCHKGIQRNKNSPSIPECVPLDEVCTGSSSNQELAVGIFSRTVSKPMIVLIDTELGFSDNHKAPPEAEGGSTDASSDTSVMSRFGLLQPHADQGIPLPGVTGIAFAAFLIGIILTGAMWFIYYQTDAAKMVRHVPVQSVGSESREMAVSSSPLTPMEYATTMI